MASIRKVYNKIIKILPKKHRINIHICNSQYDLYRTLSSHMQTTQLYPYRWQDIRDYYHDLINSDNYAYNNYKPFSDLAGIHNTSRSSKIIAVASVPILINRRALRDANEVQIAGQILHEIGHLYYRRRYGDDRFYDEVLADRYAYRWLTKLINKGIVSES